MTPDEAEAYAELASLISPVADREMVRVWLAGPTEAEMDRWAADVPDCAAYTEPLTDAQVRELTRPPDFGTRP